MVYNAFTFKRKKNDIKLGGSQVVLNRNMVILDEIDWICSLI